MGHESSWIGPAPKDATFDFPIYASLADRLGAVEFIIWDKYMVGKDYLGEVAIPIDSWFSEGTSLGFEDGANQVSRTLSDV